MLGVASSTVLDDFLWARRSPGGPASLRGKVPTLSPRPGARAGMWPAQGPLSRDAAAAKASAGYICGLRPRRGEPGRLEAPERQPHPGPPVGAGEAESAAGGELARSGHGRPRRQVRWEAGCCEEAAAGAGVSVRSVHGRWGRRRRTEGTPLRLGRRPGGAPGSVASPARPGERWVGSPGSWRPGAQRRAVSGPSCRWRRPDTTSSCERSWRPASGPAPRRRPLPPARTLRPTARPAPAPRSQPRAGRPLRRLPVRDSGS